VYVENGNVVDIIDGTCIGDGVQGSAVAGIGAAAGVGLMDFCSIAIGRPGTMLFCHLVALELFGTLTSLNWLKPAPLLWPLKESLPPR